MALSRDIHAFKTRVDRIGRFADISGIVFVFLIIIASGLMIYSPTGNRSFLKIVEVPGELFDMLERGGFDLLARSRDAGLSGLKYPQAAMYSTGSFLFAFSAFVAAIRGQWRIYFLFLLLLALPPVWFGADRSAYVQVYSWIAGGSGLIGAFVRRRWRLATGVFAACLFVNLVLGQYANWHKAVTPGYTLLATVDLDADISAVFANERSQDPAILSAQSYVLAQLSYVDNDPELVQQHLQATSPPQFTKGPYTQRRLNVMSRYVVAKTAPTRTRREYLRYWRALELIMTVLIVSFFSLAIFANGMRKRAKRVNGLELGTKPHKTD